MSGGEERGDLLPGASCVSILMAQPNIYTWPPSWPPLSLRTSLPRRSKLAQLIRTTELTTWWALLWAISTCMGSSILAICMKWWDWWQIPARLRPTPPRRSACCSSWRKKDVLKLLVVTETKGGEEAIIWKGGLPTGEGRLLKYIYSPRSSSFVTAAGNVWHLGN